MDRDEHVHAGLVRGVRARLQVGARRGPGAVAAADVGRARHQRAHARSRSAPPRAGQPDVEVDVLLVEHRAALGVGARRQPGRRARRERAHGAGVRARRGPGRWRRTAAPRPRGRRRPGQRARRRAGRGAGCGGCGWALSRCAGDGSGTSGARSYPGPRTAPSAAGRAGRRPVHLRVSPPSPADLRDRRPCPTRGVALGSLPVMDHPIRLSVTDDLTRNRLTVAFRLILGDPPPDLAHAVGHRGLLRGDHRAGSRRCSPARRRWACTTSSPSTCATRRTSSATCCSWPTPTRGSSATSPTTPTSRSRRPRRRTAGHGLPDHPRHPRADRRLGARHLLEIVSIISWFACLFIGAMPLEGCATSAPGSSGSTSRPTATDRC